MRASFLILKYNVRTTVQHFKSLKSPSLQDFQIELLQFVLELRPEAVEVLGIDASGGKELHLKSKDLTALKRQKLRALFHVTGGDGRWRHLSSYLLENIRVQADVRLELFELLCKTIESAADPSEVCDPFNSFRLQYSISRM